MIFINTTIKKAVIFLLSGMLAASVLSSCSEEASPTPTATPETTVPGTPDTTLPLTSEPTPTTTPEDTTDKKTYTVKYRSSTEFGGYIEGESEQTVVSGKRSSTIEAVAKDGYKFMSWDDGVKTPERDDIIEYNREFVAIFVMDLPEYNAPTINIITEDKEPILSKSYENAFIQVTDTKNGKYDGTFTTKIKGRGNSSWSSSSPQTSYNSKNSYRLKLDESQKFLGIGDSKNKDWVLNACKFDASLLRNYIGFKMGELLDGIDYSPECAWAHVYINGEYRGVYMITEHIEVANDRVDIDDGIETEDNGFLLELDMRGNADGVEGVDYFYVDGYAEHEDNAREWVIKSDLSLDANTQKAQFEFIKNYIQTVHNAIMGGNRDEIEALIDVDSFVDMFLCSEFSKEVDVNTASFYMYKPSGGKLHLTAPWDYDFAFGTYGVSTNISGLVTSTSSGNIWFKALLSQDWFMDLVVKRMDEITPLMVKLTDEVVGMGYALKATADANAEKWNLYAEHYHSYVSHDVSSFLYNYEEHINYLRTWMEWRWQIMVYDLEDYKNRNS